MKTNVIARPTFDENETVTGKTPDGQVLFTYTRNKDTNTDNYTVTVSSG